MEQDKLDIALEELMEFVCDKRCIYAHDLNTYQPNDEAAYEEMLDKHCAGCSEKIEEILREMEGKK